MSCTDNSCVTNYGNCLDKFGCSSTLPADFCIKRHDTKPPFKVVVENCDGAMDLTGLVLEVSMWSLAKLKKDITDADTFIQLADNVGFEQVAVGDIIVMQRVRAPEQMLVIDFDEINHRIVIQRGYHGTPVSSFKKGTQLRMFRMLNAPGTTEMDTEDIQQVDGSVIEDQITESRLVHEWAANDTCLPGCYFLEFKLIKMLENASPDENPTQSPSQTGSYTEFQMGCTAGVGVESVQRFPRNTEGYLIKVVDSPTAENLF